MAKKKKRVRKKLSRRRLFVRVLLSLVIALGILLAFLILAEFGAFREAKKVERIDIADECSRIVGNLVHVIEDAGSCKLRCDNECEIRDKEYFNSSFLMSKSGNSCNACLCECI